MAGIQNKSLGNIPAVCVGNGFPFFILIFHRRYHGKGPGKAFLVVIADRTNSSEKSAVMTLIGDELLPDKQ